MESPIAQVGPRSTIGREALNGPWFPRRGTNGGFPRRGTNGGFHRVAVAALLLLLVFAAGRTTAVLWRLVLAEPVLPQWDMAKHGLEGIHLAEALRHADAVEFVEQLHAMSIWPPAFPLLEAPAFLVFGYGYQVPRLVVCGLFFVLVVAVFWTGRALDDRDGDAVGLVAAALLCASPFYHLFATLVMLEIPGTLLLMLGLGAYWRALSRDTPGSWRLSWVLATALFFCKFNYGLMWLVPLGLNEARRWAGSWRALLERTRERLRTLDPRRPWILFLLLYAVASAAILLFPGGVGFTFGEIELSATSLGGPVYVLYLLVLLRWLVRPRHSVRRWRRWIAGLAEHHRQFVFWVLVPIAAWMIVPSHTRDFFDFVENRSSEIAFWSLDNLLFYPEVMANQFSPTPWLGWVLLVLGLAPWVVAGRRGARSRALGLVLLCSAVAVGLHPYKLLRFLATVAPLVWLSAAMALAAGLRWLARRRLPPRYAGLAALLTAAVVLAATIRSGVDLPRLRTARALRSVPAAVRPVVDAIADLAIREEGTFLLGSWNLLSPSLVEWHLWQRHPQLAAERVPGNWRDITRIRSAESIRERAMAQPTVGRLLVLDLLPEAPAATVGFSRETTWRETAWLDPLRAALAQEQAFELESLKTFPAAGYELRVYRRRPPAAREEP
ncbi:MAG: hypothetical protein GY856_46190 [bacterium]|nr:hypothetical protein [bacterium]